MEKPLLKSKIESPVYRISLQQTSQLKSIAILMMLCLHLFNTLDYQLAFRPLIFVGSKPLIYYISLFCDACVFIFAFVSGYGLYFQYKHTTRKEFQKKNVQRIKKLYWNLWIIILIFPLGLGLVLSKPGFPGSIWNFILNFTGLLYSYNGAWWFFTIYLIFALTSTFWFRAIERLPTWLGLIIFSLLYLVAFYFRYYVPVVGELTILTWLKGHSILFFCTLLQFLLGAYVYKENWDSKVMAFWNRLNSSQIFLFFGIVLLIIFHGLFPNIVFAAITGLGFVFLFINMKLPVALKKGIDFFVPHSTNIWLVHMFFYLTFFREFIYSPRYVPLIFLLLVLVSTLSSYVINAILKLASTMKKMVLKRN